MNSSNHKKIFCQYCGKNHPFDTKYCPITGQKLTRAFSVRFNTVNNLIITLSFLASVIAFIYTNNSDIFKQNNTVYLPYRSLFSISDKANLSDLLDIKDNQKPYNMAYIFVIDLSGSMKFQNNNANHIDIYRKIEKTLNSYFDLNYRLVERPSLFDISKFELFSLLLDIEDSNTEFSIWTLGNNSFRLYPRKKLLSSSNKNNILDAIKSLIEINHQDNKDQNTDFLDLFSRLSYSIEQENNNYIFKTFIFSDLIHDIQNKIEIEKEGYDDKVYLLKTVMNKLTKYNIEINFVAMNKRHTNLVSKDSAISNSKALNGAKPNYKIVNYFEEKELRKRLIHNTISENPINFYYRSNIFDSNFIVDIDKPGNYQIAIHSIRNGSNNEDNIKYDIQYRINNDLGIYKTLENGYQDSILLENGDKLFLKHTGFLPKQKDLKLGIKLTNQKLMNYYIPICYNKNLSIFSSLVIIFCHFLLVIGGITLFLTIVSVIIKSFVVNKEEQLI